MTYFTGFTDFNQWLKTQYQTDADYSTNAPNYYDDLALKQKLFELLAKKIWDYDQELAKRFLEWDKNLEEFDEEVIKLLKQWINDGTFAHIINHEIFANLNEDIAINSRNRVSVERFKHLVVNGDWQPAVQAAIASLPAAGGMVIIPFNITIKSPIVLNKRVTLSGISYSSRQTDPENAVTTILKDGNFKGIILQKDNTVVENLHVKGAALNGGDGISVEAARTSIRNVSVMEMGGNGIRIGNDSGANCNIWRLDNVLTLYNTGNGIYVHDGIASNRDVNAGTITGLDTRSNGKDGLVFGNTSDNSVYGLVAQNNGGTGIRFSPVTFGNYVANPYVEANKLGNTKEIVLEAGSYKNTVLGHPAKAAYLMVDDLGTSNLIQTYDVSQSGAPPFFQSLVGFLALSITGGSGTGNWQMVKDNGNLVIKPMQTSSSRELLIKHPVDGSTVTTDLQQFKVNSGILVKAWTSRTATLTFTTVPAHGQSERTVVMAGAQMGDVVTANPTTAPLSGLIWSAYVSAPDTVTVRMGNVTPNPIVTQEIVFRVDVIKH